MIGLNVEDRVKVGLFLSIFPIIDGVLWIFMTSIVVLC